MYAATSSVATRIGRGFECLLVLLATIAFAACALAPAAPDDVPTSAASGSSFAVVVRTERGDLTLSIDAAAAPQAVAALRQAFEQGGFAGARMVWVRPHTEIRTEAPQGVPASMASELDARILGLHQQRIEDIGAAMNAIQFELEPAFLRAGNRASPQLRDWIATWRRDFDASFLVGTSRQQINEALGYRYRDGPASRPLRRGSVALVAAEPGSTTLALAILLRDQPTRDGRWVVVGQVLSGIDLADALSIAPRLHPKSSEPVQPVRIVATEITEVLTDRGTSP